MTRTRAASLPAGVRPRMVFGIHERDISWPQQDEPLTPAELTDLCAQAEQIAAELSALGAGIFDSPRTTDAGRLLTPRRAAELFERVHDIERRYFGRPVDLRDLNRYAGGLTGLLARLADDLLSWLVFWDTYRAQHPAGFAEDCPAPPTADLRAADTSNPDEVAPIPPPQVVQQLTAAPAAPPAGPSAS